MQTVRYQGADKSGPGMAVVAMEVIFDAGENFPVDGPIHPGDIDVGEPHGHAAGPIAAITADFFVEADFARKNYKCCPMIAVAQVGALVHSAFADPAGKSIDHLTQVLPSTCANSSSANMLPFDNCALASALLSVVRALCNRLLLRVRSANDQADTPSRSASVFPSVVLPERLIPHVSKLARL